MSEPKLEDIGDYNTLKGEKKRIVWAVIIAGLLLGVIYMIANKVYNDKGDAIPVKDEITVVPLSKSIPVR
ncbi:hypothetical protein [Sulfurimonas autotrophica]|uniref:Uncharacterized protein n=1 Tax=Sulfurimonas autotrophica (strain ATCC BAA-671 / DSM 16294 / JCM 11897 / OK10) TaxID=563040 RepID=E0UU98_SULAO|nr:hypothetical protein [Sulfurimonas autotrophica]ADN09473.1 hypothetical protein Saut_1426 [Sulfurimonas autotrophica DSM 16294]